MAPKIDNPQRNKRHYDEWVAGPRYLLRRYSMMQLMKGTEPGRSLEIGFGAGVFLLELERMGFEAWGVDLNPACIESVVRRLPSALLDGPGSKRQLHEGGLKEMRVQRHKWGESDRH